MATLEEQYKQFLIENPDSELTFEEWKDYKFKNSLSVRPKWENNLENDWKEWENLSNVLSDDDEDATGWEKLDIDNWDNFLPEPKKDTFT